MTLADEHWSRPGTTVDGMPTWERASDIAGEQRVAAQIEHAWGWTMHRYPRFHSIDFYAEQRACLVAHVEIRCRSNASTAFPTVYLSERKYHVLHELWVAQGLPCLYVWGFTDCTRWIDVACVDASRPRVRGRLHQQVDGANNLEPMIEVPIGMTRSL